MYKLLAPGLLPRLPLRNLNWPSHSGPVRSIDSLHVDLVEGGGKEPDAAADRPSGSAPRDDGFQTQHVGGQTSAEDVSKQPAAKSTARRHQIPGLRNTPYLKVLLLRCDDNDSYKTTVRSEVREWIKKLTPTSSSKRTNAPENHDAGEWIIVHVVIPNTAAATQPRSSGKIEGSSTEKSTSRWRTGTTPLLEKLRSDFNSSSKGAPDRVAQIRIGINDVPYDMLPRVVPAVPSGYSETDADAEAAWNELINKFKSLILSSFDMRVTQYEDDIKEKDGQRSLPGWNFCTFFILKEGLARGFESVGLVEDALVGYDELSVGLDSVIHEQAESGEPEKHGGAMLPYTEDVQRAAKRALAQLTGEDGDEAEDLQGQAAKVQADDIPIVSSKKAYRDMILANKVSVFDFRCYIFSRQISLLLRLGNASATREELLAKLKDQYESVLHGVAPLVPPMNKDDGLENLGMLSEVCRRTLEFIPSVSQDLRREIAASLDADESVERLVSEAVDNLVSSFAFSVAQQILAQTSTKALPIPPTIIAKGDGTEPKSSIPEPKTMMHPARMSSLPPPPPPSPGVFPGPGRRATAAEEAQTATFLKVGLEELAAQRAELYMLSRSVLERLGKKRGWSNGWDEVDAVGGDLGEMEEIDLGDKSEGPRVSPSTAGIDGETLRTAMDDEDDFYRLYEILTDRAIHHFSVASHQHAIQACRADLAVLKVHMKEYKVATSYFEGVTQFFGRNGWSLLELSMLAMYAQSLGQHESDSGYVRVAMKLITEYCSNERERLQHASRKAAVDVAPIREVAKKLFTVAKELPSEVKVSLTSFVTDLDLEGFPEYTDDEDSCSLRISMTSLLPQDVALETAKLKITTDNGPCREISFESADATLRPGRNIISVKTNVSNALYGMYPLTSSLLSLGPTALAAWRFHRAAYSCNTTTVRTRKGSSMPR